MESYIPVSDFFIKVLLLQVYSGSHPEWHSVLSARTGSSLAIPNTNSNEEVKYKSIRILLVWK